MEYKSKAEGIANELKELMKVTSMTDQQTKQFKSIMEAQKEKDSTMHYNSKIDDFAFYDLASELKELMIATKMAEQQIKIVQKLESGLRAYGHDSQANGVKQLPHELNVLAAYASVLSKKAKAAKKVIDSFKG
ncbi:hypothetical protein FBF91_08220 [Campylobacter upsaliensis]|uniref:hypothetical protein n=1 Tax=Campylobacter upsaliensis TaxID=28080 RepID=UPI0012C2D650|nr:hypothetical protein [Campylobacter upsaliensis]EAK7296981.1 hypothetical protein [Campylobacter upsaliensis]MBJ6809608.1 hypothetical protein [Campylobacter upsaliensis]